jgi:hypothetical protein
MGKLRKLLKHPYHAAILEKFRQELTYAQETFKVHSTPSLEV